MTVRTVNGSGGTRAPSLHKNTGCGKAATDGVREFAALCPHHCGAIRREGPTVSEAQRTGEAPKSGIVWLASYPRSGNTWTRSFIHNLMRVKAEEEGEQDINEMMRFSFWDIAKPLYTAELGFAPGTEHRRDIARVRHQVQQRIADAFEGLVFVKTHHALVTDRDSTTINFAVTSGAIYIVRNPLDVAISLSHHRATSIDEAIEVMGAEDFETSVGDEAVYEVYGSWSQHVGSWTRKPHRAIYVMRYEDMLAEPERIFGGLARHLLLGASAANIARAVELSSFERLAGQEAEKGFREKPAKAERFFREGRAEQWKDILTKRQVDRIVHDHAGQMARFGYLPAG